MVPGTIWEILDINLEIVDGEMEVAAIKMMAGETIIMEEEVIKMMDGETILRRNSLKIMGGETTIMDGATIITIMVIMEAKRTMDGETISIKNNQTTKEDGVITIMEEVRKMMDGETILRRRSLLIVKDGEIKIVVIMDGVIIQIVDGEILQITSRGATMDGAILLLKIIQTAVGVTLLKTILITDGGITQAQTRALIVLGDLDGDDLELMKSFFKIIRTYCFSWLIFFLVTFLS